MAESVRYNIDSSGAERGARRVVRSLDEIRAASRRAGEGHVTHRKAMTGLDRASKGVGRTLRSVASGLGLLVGVAAVAAGIRSLATEFTAFDKAMTESIAIMDDVDGAMRDRMTVAAQVAGEELNFSATQGAEAFFFLASAGLKAEQSIAALPAVAAFAKAGMFDFATATDLATDAQSALGLTVADAQQNLTNLTRVTDVLVKANTQANATVQQFSEALTNRAGAALRLVNKDVEEGVAILAAFADQGVKGGRAGQQLGIVLRDLQRRAIENRDAFKAAEIAVFDAEGEMNNFADILGDIERRFGSMSTEGRAAELMLLGFSDRSAAALSTLIGTSDAIREYEEALRDAGGTTQAVAEKQMNNLTEQAGALRQRIVNLSSDILSQYGPAWVDTLKRVNESFDRNRSGIVALTEIAVDGFKVIGNAIALPIRFAFNLGQQLGHLVTAFAELASGDLGGAKEAFGRIVDEALDIDDAFADVVDSTERFTSKVDNLSTRMAELDQRRAADEAAELAVAEAKAALEAENLDEALGDTNDTVDEAVQKSRDYVAALQAQISDTRELTNAAAGGIDVLERVGRAQDLRNRQDEAAAEVTEEYRDEVRALVAELDLEAQALDIATRMAEEHERTLTTAERSIAGAMARTSVLLDRRLRQLEAEARAAAEVEEETRELRGAYEEAGRAIQESFSNAFDSILTDGLDGFQGFAEEVLGIFRALASEIVATMAADALGIPELLADLQAGKSPGGLAGGALKYGTGAFVGGQAGFSSGNPFGGALAGGAAGFATGGPIGGIIGAVGGIVGGLFGSAEKAKEAARIAAEAEVEWRSALTDLGNLFADPSTFLEDATDEIRERTLDLLNAVDDTIPDFSADAFTEIPSLDEIEKAIEAARRMASAGGKVGEQGEKLVTFFERLKEVLEESGEAAQRAEEAFRKEQAAFERGVQIETLRLQGLDKMAAKMELAARQEEALADAVSRGYSDSAIRALEYLHELQRVALEEELAAEAARKLQEAERARRQEALARASVERDLVAREARLAGDDRAALAAQLEDQVARELEAARQQVEEGTRTEEQYRRLAEVLRGEVNRELEAFDENLSRLAEAARRANEAALEDLEVRQLRAKGLEREAELLAFQLAQQREIEKFISEGRTDDVISKLRETQALEAERFRRELEEKYAPDQVDGVTEREVARRRGDPTGSGTDTITSSNLSTVTQSEFRSGLGLWRSQLVELRSIRQELRRIRSMSGGGGSGGQSNVNEELGSEADRDAAYRGIPVGSR